jgi:[ribosomal protein S5]-alanine N-acetyltransferase
VPPFPIVTDRLLLREFRIADESAIHAYASDPEVTRYTSWGPNTPEVTHRVLQQWISAQENWPRPSLPLAIELRSESKLIGGTGFASIDCSAQMGIFGFVLRKDYWGKGIATETARAVVRFGFERLKLHRVVAECFVENFASARVLTKLGMRREAHFVENTLKAGQWRDTYLYALLREEWRQQHSSDARF